MKKALLFSVVLLFATVSLWAAPKKGQKTAFFKSNMHCLDCQNVLFEHLRFEKGVKDLQVDHVTNTVKVVFTAARSSEEVLAASIKKKGYTAEPITEEEYKKLLQNPVAPAHHHAPAHRH